MTENKHFNTINAKISPDGEMEILSNFETKKLLDTAKGGLYHLFRNCALAVLNSGSDLDDGKELLERYPDFDIELIQRVRGIKLNLKNAPARAFVDGKLIKSISEHLFSLLRDIIYLSDAIDNNPQYDLQTSDGITNAVFHILRNANIIFPLNIPNLGVCWGGHSIARHEYEYTKEVGYQMGLRGLDICTGSGPGAMKGPMKGAAIGHAKQRRYNGRYIGMTEPGIIAAESPNPIVNSLVILPDIEKRLEAFVRIGHAFIVFPGGAGTAEEIIFLLGILMNPANKKIPFPFILTGPEEAKDYFAQIDQFIGVTLGSEAQKHYQIIIGNPEAVAKAAQKGMRKVRLFRKNEGDAYYFNWLLKIEPDFQQPFHPTHENMRNLALHKDQKPHQLAANLRRVFSGIVAGNVKDEGIRSIEKHGHFEIRGAKEIMDPIDALLQAFVEQQRMKLPGSQYRPCYKIIS